MRCLALVGALWFWAASSIAFAQIEVSAQTSRSTFLLYERVDLHVTIANIGDTDIILNNDEGHPWLSFLIAKHDRLPVSPERRSDFQPLTLKVGESKTLSVNITPLFSFREAGDYKASAVVDLPGQGEIISTAVPFTVIEGHKIWSQQRAVEGSQRIYSLLRFSSTPDSTQLYLRVEAPDENTVYTNIALGEMVSSVDPEVFFDPKGNIHVLHPIALSTYLYTRADPAGKILDQRIFKTFREVPPRLTKLDDGDVFVAGGLVENPDAPREKLSDAQGIKKPDAPAASAQ
ncbi:hypothetical protein OAG63_00150 [Methylacidiphilales bacterium]|nr:hypothetical protein [Candidatus Methylacidiphilales bacterium]